VDRRRTVSNEESLLWLKGAVESLVASLHAGSLEFARCDHPAMEPGWAVEISLNGARVGVMGLVSAALRHPWRLTSPMPLAELSLLPLLAGVSTLRTIRPVPQYPAVRRDIAFVSDASVTHRDVVDLIKKAGPRELTEVELFDIFQSKEMGKGKRSLAYTLSFRSPDRTLTDVEVNDAFAKIVQALKKELNVEVREG
jgi:phenylalanyl-tRNA synthetase beta chain